MNIIKNNIVYVDSESYYKDDLKLKYFLDKNKEVVLEKIDSLLELDRKDGFLLILTMDDLYRYNSNLVDIDNVNVYEIDRYVRKLFKNFEYVILISIEEFDYGKINFSNIYIEFANKYFNIDKGISLLVEKLYNEYKFKEDIKYSRIKISNINKLKQYIDKQDSKFITSKDIIRDLSVNKKWIQRYMKDMNNIYNNIGYNKKTRLWYIVDSD